MIAHGNEFVSALKDMMQIIDTEYKGMIIGGMAVIALGYPRATTDIDSTVFVHIDRLERFVLRLKEKGIEPRIDNAINFARENHVLLMRHKLSQIDIDISLALLPFEEDAISNRQMVDFGGIKIAVPKVDDLLIYKMVASRPEDVRDVEELLIRYIDKIDINKVKDTVCQFAEVLERPEMIKQLDELIKRVKEL